MAQPIELIVGLGNPEPKYLITRHNAGFWFADALAREHGASFSKDKKLFGESCEIRIDSQRIRLLKPATFMNLSGQSVSAAVTYYKIPAEHVLVVYDEMDLPPGTARLKFDGGDAGHNGVRDVAEHIGRGFWRLRLGVGHPGSKGRVLGHVLNRAHGDEEKAILDAIRRGIAVLPTLIALGGQRAQNVLHAQSEPARDEAKDGPGES
jgi:PTH1 family peptidyl-tRNA hydrolase